MTEEEKKQAGGGAASEVLDALTGGAPSDGGEDAPAQSKRDAFRSRVKKESPDLDMDDEDAYYDRVNGMLDERDGYAANSARLRDNLAKSPMMLRLLQEAKDQENFDPVVFLVEHDGLDLEALGSDPDYAEKLAAARKSYLEKNARGSDIQKQMEANLPKSVEMVKKVGGELGLDEDKQEELVGKMYQIMDDLIVGKIDEGLFRTLAKGDGFDEAVAGAREEGQAEGLNTKVDDTLRDLSSKTPQVSGSQKPQPSGPKQKPELRNPLRFDGKF